MQIHPIVRLFSGAILLAAAALIIPSPLIDPVQAAPECPYEPENQCEESCCDDYDFCATVAEDNYLDCVAECYGDPGCENECEDDYLRDLEFCEGDLDACRAWCV